ncbi:MAG: PAS domain-containing protein [Hydrococcus sp. C42_A2020_068]|uniref:PAS domain-containing protein n=1 Tax=Pleurocapsa sp. PCC 7327 TaxID=118163 RepID=UPI00029FE654|nr:PAS domain-containing protein [Pleurocapsa sp. PCC 7327]AFY77967.1 PAS domain S-box [Pleurocapsa sp. PCC 7327]MBF2019204.1 PAS domain-containing protein [Hydrococcus sp. C42_A2020_068]
MLEANQNNLWQLLWEYDPNGLIVVDADLYVKLVNPAFCKMFNVKSEDIIGQPASVILDDVKDFQKVWENGEIIRGQSKYYPRHNIYVREVIFPIEDEGVVASIMVDTTHEIDRIKELSKIKIETVKKVNQVVDKQMKVVQEIAGLLGETTAETKVSLLQVIQMLETENL